MCVCPPPCWQPAAAVNGRPLLEVQRCDRNNSPWPRWPVLVPTLPACVLFWRRPALYFRGSSHIYLTALCVRGMMAVTWSDVTDACVIFYFFSLPDFIFSNLAFLRPTPAGTNQVIWGFRRHTLVFLFTFSCILYDIYGKKKKNKTQNGKLSFIKLMCCDSLT